MMNKETGTPYSREELLTAFNSVANKENWKYPIKSVVASKYRDVVEEAVIYFTGSVPKFKKGNGFLYVSADGYYKAIGA